MQKFYFEYLHFIKPSKIQHALRVKLVEKLHAVRGELKKVTIKWSKSDALRRKSKIIKKDYIKIEPSNQK